MNKLIACLALSTLALPTIAAANIAVSSSVADLSLAAKQWAITPEVGITQYSYRETLVPEISETAINTRVNGAFTYGLPEGVEVGTTLGYTLLPLSVSYHQRFQYFTNDTYAGYTLPGNPHGLRVKLVGGFFFRHMSVTNDAYGWDKIYGPQLYPAFSMELPNAQAVNGYIKIMPITNVDGFSGDNWEMAVGMGYRLTTPADSYQLRMNFDYTWQKVTADSVLVGRGSRMNALTASVSYGI